MKPAVLAPGDMIGIVAPASPAKPEQLQKAINWLVSLGYRVKVGTSAQQHGGYLAGSDELRARDLEQMFADKQVQAIFCLRGGFGVTRILPLLDFTLIAQHPKILVGYSDITALHLALQQKTDFRSFHGPMLTELAERPHPLSEHCLFSQCTQTTAFGYYPIPSDTYTITPGTATGSLIGGNLTLLTATLGTPYEINTLDKILFIEEVDEAPYRVDRMLTQLKQAGKLVAARGIILTDFTDCDAEDSSKSRSLSEVFHDIIGSIGIPAYFGLQSGHTSPNLTLPIGGQVEMDATDCWLACAEGNVIQKNPATL